MNLQEPQDVIAALRARNPKADPLRFLPDMHPGKLPRHIAIIMDGNGRWATQRGKPRFMGHREGAKSVEKAIELAGLLGVEVLTLFSFSMENWRRPKEEIDALMSLYVESIDVHADRLDRDGIRFRQIGRREGLPELVQQRAAELEHRTRNNTHATLCLAVNYGGRAEIVDACRTLAEKVSRGELAASAIDEGAVAGALYAPDLPDPDLLIRTAGETRISNFLLWQVSYAEIHVTQTLWPDFGDEDLLAAIRDYAGRTRKFGALGK